MLSTSTIVSLRFIEWFLIMAIFISIIVIIVFGVSYFRDDNKEDSRWVFIGIVALIIFSVCLYSFKHCTNWYKYEYQKHVNRIENAEKTLQKFLVEHPEFKEIENEIY